MRPRTGSRGVAAALNSERHLSKWVAYGARMKFQLPYEKDEAEMLAAFQTTVRCGLCQFSFVGSAEDATRAGREHALKVHGLTPKKRRRHDNPDA